MSDDRFGDDYDHASNIVISHLSKAAESAEMLGIEPQMVILAVTNVSIDLFLRKNKDSDRTKEESVKLINKLIQIIVDKVYKEEKK